MLFHFQTVSFCVPCRTGPSGEAYLWHVNECACLGWTEGEGRAERRRRVEWVELASGWWGCQVVKSEMRQGPGVCGGLQICACTRRGNTGRICRQLCVCVCMCRGGASAQGRGLGVWSWVVVLGGGGAERGGGGVVDLRSEHNQPSVFIRLVVCESRNKCV